MVDISYKKGGTFEPEPQTPAGTNNTRVTGETEEGIEWRFKINADCSCVFLVSVFHLRKDKKFVQDPWKDGLLDPNQHPSHAGRDVKGYVVDTPIKRGQGGKPIHCVAYRNQKRIHDMLVGDDKPGAKKPGFEQHFETAAICFDAEGGDKYTVLGSMNWIYGVDNKVRLVRNPAGGIDSGDVTEGFKGSLRDWIDTYGNNCTKECFKAATEKSVKIATEQRKYRYRIREIDEDLKKLAKKLAKAESEEMKADLAKKRAGLEAEKAGLKEKSKEAAERLKASEERAAVARKAAEKAKAQRDKARKKKKSKKEKRGKKDKKSKSRKKD